MLAVLHCSPADDDASVCVARGSSNISAPRPAKVGFTNVREGSLSSTGPVLGTGPQHSDSWQPGATLWRQGQPVLWDSGLSQSFALCNDTEADLVFATPRLFVACCEFKWQDCGVRVYCRLLVAAQFSVTFRLYERWRGAGRHHRSPHLVATVYTAQGDSGDWHNTSNHASHNGYLNELIGINM